MGAAFTATTKFTAIDKMSATMKKMSRGVQGFAAKTEVGINRADRAFRRLTPGIGKAAKQFLSFASAAAITTGAILAVSSSLGDVLKFETGLVGVGKTTGIAGKELKALGQEIVKTSNELRTIDTLKLLELGEAAGQLGVTGTQNILKFSTVLAKLEKASDIAGEEGAKSIARLLTITKEGVGIVDQFSSALVELGNTSAASEAEILGVASEVGRATAAYKLSSQEILGISASLKSLDVAPEAAGSAIGKVFRGIELATIKGGKNLQAFAKVMGQTPEQIKQTFADSPRKAFTTFVKGLGRISEEGGSVAKALLDVGLSGERISKGIVPLAVNFELLEEKLRVSSEAFKENSALQKEFDASQKTVQSGLASISRAWSNLAIKQANAGGALESVQNALFFVSDNLGAIVGTIGAVVAGWIAMKTILIVSRTALATYNVTMGIYNALFTKSVVLTNKNILAQKAYIFTTKAMIVVTKIFDAVMKATPLGIIITGLTLFAAAAAAVVLSMDNLTTAERLSGQVRKRTLDNTIDQRVQVTLLFATLKRAKEGTEEYTEALRKVEKLSPGLVEKYDLQRKSIEGLNLAEKEWTKSILARAMAQARVEILQEKTKELLLSQQKGVSTFDKLAGIVSGLPAAASKAAKEIGLQKEIDVLGGQISQDQAKQVNPAASQQAALQNGLQETIKETRTKITVDVADGAKATVEGDRENVIPSAGVDTR